MPRLLIYPYPKPPPLVLGKPMSPTSPQPLTAGELVEIATAPDRAWLHQVWCEYEAETRLANINTHMARAWSKRAVRHASIARQYLIVARLVGTVPLAVIHTPEIN